LVVAAGCGSSESPPAKKDTGVGPGIDGPVVKTDAILPGIEVQKGPDVQPGPEVQVTPPDVGQPDVVIPPPDVPADRPVERAPTGGAGGSIDGGTGGATGAGGAIAIDGGTGGKTGAGGAIAIDGGTGGKTGVGGATTAAGGATTAAGGATTAAGGATTAAGGATTAAGGATTAAGGATTAAGGSGGGQGGSTTVLVPVLEGWPTSIVLDTVTCAGVTIAPETAEFTLRNTSDGTGVVTDKQVAGSPGFTIDLQASAPPTTILAGASKIVAVSGPSIPPSTTPGQLSSVQTIKTNEPATHVITVNQTVQGAVLEWGAGAGANLPFGGYAPGDVSSHPFSVRNTGNFATTFNLSVTFTPTEAPVGYPAIPSTTFQITGGSTTAIEIGPGGTVTRNLVFTAPAAQANYTATVHMTAGTIYQCRTPAADWTATATSLNGYPDFTPDAGNTLHFVAACGSGASSKPITIHNVGTASLGLTLGWENRVESCGVTFSAVIDDPFVPAGGTATATVSVTSFPATKLTEVPCSATLVINHTDEGLGTLQDRFYLVATPLGDVVTFTWDSEPSFEDNYVVGRTPESMKSVTLYVTNSEFDDPTDSNPTTAIITLDIAQDTAGAFSFKNNTSDLQEVVTVQAGSTVPVPVFYIRPLAGSTQNILEHGTLSWSRAAGPNCGNSPGLVSPLEGKTSEGQVVAGFVSGNDFGTIFCGATGAERIFRISNSGSGFFDLKTFAITPYTGNGTATHFRLTDYTYYPATGGSTHRSVAAPGLSGSLTGVLLPGDYVDFVIAPDKLDPAEAHGYGYAGLGNTAGHTKFWDTLTITTDEPDNQTVPQDLKMYAQGAIIAPPADQPIAWSFNPINWAAAHSATLVREFTNQGNVPAYAVLTGNTVLLPVPTGGDPTQKLFRLNPDVLAPNGTSDVTSVLGPYDRCDTQSNPNVDDSATLQFVVDVTDHLQQTLPENGIAGFCYPATQTNIQATIECPLGGGVPLVTSRTGRRLLVAEAPPVPICGGAWTSTVSLHGTVEANSSICQNGQLCDTGSGLCGCDLSSCPTGCCTLLMPTLGGLCLGNQNGACGNTGGLCETCSAGNSCQNYQCLCNSTACANEGGCCGGTPSTCRVGTTADYCGTDGLACSTCGYGNECNAEQACTCGATSCVGGCCGGGGEGSCQTGTTEGACGSNAGTCDVCTGKPTGQIVCGGTEGDRKCVCTAAPSNSCIGQPNGRTTCSVSGGFQGECVCDAASCTTGCCNGNSGGCAAGTSPGACGTSGTCNVCSGTTPACSDGACVCSGNSCGSGIGSQCCGTDGSCQTGNQAAACGSNGSCSDCTARTDGRTTCGDFRTCACGATTCSTQSNGRRSCGAFGACVCTANSQCTAAGLTGYTCRGNGQCCTGSGPGTICAS